MRLTDLVRGYLTDPRYLSNRRSVETYDHCLRQYVAHVTVTLGLENSVKNFVPDTIESFVAQCFKAGMKETTVNLRLAALQGLGQYGLQQKHGGKYILQENPVIRVKRPKNRRPPIKFLVPDELKVLMNAECQPNERLALMLMVDQPLRVSEWCDATVKDLVLDGDKVALTVQVKGGSYKRKILGDKVAKALQSSLTHREAGPDEPLLVNTKGEKYTRQTFSAMVARVARRAGITRIQVRAHVIRHSIASLAAAMDASDHEIADMLNHAGTGTVKVYVHGVRADPALARVREALDG